MKTNRRGFFATLGAALVAPKLPVPKPISTNYLTPLASYDLAQYSNYISISCLPYKKGDLYAEILGKNAAKSIDQDIMNCIYDIT